MRPTSRTLPAFPFLQPRIGRNVYVPHAFCPQGRTVCVSPDHRFFFQTGQHREALATLYYAVRQRRGFALLVGRPGLGKTTVLVQLLEMLREEAETAYLPHPYFDRNTVLESILLSLGLETTNSLAQNHRLFYQYLVEGVRDKAFRSKLNSFNLVCPDGQPVRWCLNYFYGAGLKDRVCGTTAMLRICEAAAAEGLGIYLYGSTPKTLAALETELTTRFPRLRIAGSESPPFRPLKGEELDEAVERINKSGAAFLFVGLGSPKQENFVWEQRSRIMAVQLCVGAAFDFIAGTKERAPLWMQRIGLEWLYRMCSEPGRLGKRYLLGNMHFLALLMAGVLCIWRPASKDATGASGCDPV